LTPAVLSEVYGATVRVIDDAGVPVVVPGAANNGGRQ